MRIVVIAIGRLKHGPESELAEAYRRRAQALARSLGIGEIEIVELRQSRAREAAQRRVEESMALARTIPDRAFVVALDERGANLDSAALARLLQKWRAQEHSAVCFVIGGADGITASLLGRADLKLAYGTATWPHQLARVMLLEQLYRAATILSGHPYHRP